MVTPQKRSRTTELTFVAVSRILARFSWFLVRWAQYEQGIQLPCAFARMKRYFHFNFSFSQQINQHAMHTRSRNTEHMQIFFPRQFFACANSSNATRRSGTRTHEEESNKRRKRCKNINTPRMGRLSGKKQRALACPELESPRPLKRRVGAGNTVAQAMLQALLHRIACCSN